MTNQEKLIKDLRNTNFDKWWYEVGSAIKKEDKEDHEEFAKRLSKIVWLTCAARSSILLKDKFLTLTNEFKE